MRVLHCISWLSMGGAERQLYYIAREQARLGHEIHIVYTNGDNIPAGYRNSGVSLWKLSCVHNHDPSLILKMIGLLRRLKPDMVQSWIIQMDVIAGISAALAGIPWILREPSSANAWPSNMKNGLRALVARTAKAVISNSSAGAEYWKKHIPAARCVVLPNALPISEIEGALPKTGRISEKRLVLYAGRLNQREKNFLGTLIALMEVVRQREVDVAILGDGPERKQAQEAVQAAGLRHRILFYGQCDDVWAWMKSASVFVNASFVEGQPNAVLEAMTCNLPVVLSNIPAHRELAPNGTAWFVDPDPPSSILNGIFAALDDPAEAAARAGRARALVGQFSVSRAASDYLDVYDRVKG